MHAIDKEMHKEQKCYASHEIEVRSQPKPNGQIVPNTNSHKTIVLLVTPVLIFLGVIFLALLFRAPVGRCIDRLQSLVVSTSALEAKFASLIASDASASEVPREIGKGPAGGSCPGVTDDVDKVLELEKLAQRNGIAAIMDAYRELELAVIGAATRRGLPIMGGMGRVSGSAAADSLDSNKITPTNMRTIFYRLREARMLSHKDDFIATPTAASNYFCAALSLAEAYRNVK